MKPGIIGIIGVIAVILIALAGAYFVNQSFNHPVLPGDLQISEEKTGDKQEVENVLTIDSNLAIGSDAAITK